MLERLPWDFNNEFMLNTAQGSKNYHKAPKVLQRYFADQKVHTTHLNHLHHFCYLHHFRHIVLRLKSNPHKNLHHVLDVWMLTQDCSFRHLTKFWHFLLLPYASPLQDIYNKKSSPEYFYQTFKIYSHFIRGPCRLLFYRFLLSSPELLYFCSLFVPYLKENI